MTSCPPSLLYTIPTIMPATEAHLSNSGAHPSGNSKKENENTVVNLEESDGEQTGAGEVLVFDPLVDLLLSKNKKHITTPIAETS